MNKRSSPIFITLLLIELEAVIYYNYNIKEITLTM